MPSEDGISSLLVQILFILLLIILNGVFSMAELAIVSARRARLQHDVEQGDRRAQVALELASTPNRLLSTLQIGITLVGVLAGAVGGATIADRLAVALRRIPWLAEYSGSLALFLVVLGTTYLSLVVGELVPKRLAMNNPERIARAMAGPMRALSVVISPFVRLLSFSTDLILRLLGVRPSEEPPVTEDEIRVLIEQGTEAGVFQEVEQSMVESVFRLDERRVSSLMTPRPDVVWLDLDDPMDELHRKIAESPYSRFPVGQGDLDHLLGEVEAKDLLARHLAGDTLDIRALVRPSLYVPDTLPALRVLESFRQSGTEMAVVIDEYGSVVGLVTLTDILEAIVGDIPSPEELAEPEIVRREDGSWLLGGMLTVDEVKDLLDLDSLPDEDRGLYQTLGGFVVTQLGRIPVTTDHFEWTGWRFEVVDMDGPRVDKVMVVPLPKDEAEAPLNDSEGPKAD